MPSSTFLEVRAYPFNAWGPYSGWYHWSVATHGEVIPVMWRYSGTRPRILPKPLSTLMKTENPSHYENRLPHLRSLIDKNNGIRSVATAVNTQRATLSMVLPKSFNYIFAVDLKWGFPRFVRQGNKFPAKTRKITKLPNEKKHSTWLIKK